MDGDLLKSMFLKARDQYESSVRWAFLTVLFLGLLHLITFSQFVQLKGTLASTEAAVQQMAEAAAAVENLATELSVLHKSFLGRLETRLDNMQGELMADFQDLQQTLARLDSPTTAEFAGARAEDLLGGQDMALQSAVQQSAPPARSGLEPSIQLAEAVKARLRQARTREEVLEILQPVIAEQIINRRFEQLNDYWHNRLEADVVRQTNLVLDQVAEQRALFPEGAEQWAAIEAELKQTAEAAGTLQFQPFTDDPYWWTTVAGKGETLDGVAEAAINQLGVEESAQAVRQLQQQVTAALERQQQLQTEVQQELEALEQTFLEQQEKLATLGQPYELLALDLDFLVVRFPLILGIFLAAITVWPVYRLQELAWAVALLSERSEGQSSWEWFYVRSGLPLSATVVTGQEVGGQFWWQGRARLVDILGRGLFFCGWIGLAAWQLADLPDTDPFWLAAAGGAVVLVALGYRWYGLSRIAGLGRRLSPAPRAQTSA